jgi:O-antigen/teichoic acid export membrane protein
VNLSSFLFHIELSRLLGPGNYGAINSILSILTLIAVPIGAAQLAVTQVIVGYVNKDQKFSLSKITKRALFFGLAAMIIFSIFIPFQDKFLHLHSAVPLVLVAIWVPIATVGAVLQGALIGEFRFRSVAFATFMSGGPVRLLLGLGMVKAGWGVSGAVLATIFAQLFSTTSLFVSARDNYGAHLEKIHVKTSGRDMALSIAAVGGFTALSGVDTFLARHYFSAHLAGVYAAGAVAAHIALFAPLAIVSVVFPHLVENDGEQSRKAFVQASWLTIGIGVVTAIFLTTFSTFVVNVLFGSRFSGSNLILGILSFTSTFFGLINLLVYSLIAKRSVMALLPWLGVGTAVFVIGMRHTALDSVAWAMFSIGLLTCGACLSAVLYTIKLSSTKVTAGV